MLVFEPAALPLEFRDDGTIRIIGTRVPLDTVVAAFRKGATPEEISRQYPTVTVAGVYAIIAWVLQHQGDVEEYLARREAESALIREECERLHPSDGIRARLIQSAQRGAMTSNDASNHGVCAVCGGSLAPGKTTIPFVRGERVLTIRDIPADICGDCGEAYLSSEIVDRVQEQVRRLEALDAEVSIARYHAA